MNDLHYCLQTAHLECGVTRHPQEEMKALGITYQHSTPQSMGDCWQFWNCENIPEDLPEYLSINDRDPMTYIGYGLSKDLAEKVRDGRAQNTKGDEHE